MKNRPKSKAIAYTEQKLLTCMPCTKPKGKATNKVIKSKKLLLSD